MLIAFDSCIDAFSSLVRVTLGGPDAHALVHQSNPIGRSSNTTDAREQPDRPVIQYNGCPRATRSAGHPIQRMPESTRLTLTLAPGATCIGRYAHHGQLRVRAGTGWARAEHHAACRVVAA